MTGEKIRVHSVHDGINPLNIPCCEKVERIYSLVQQGDGKISNALVENQHRPLQ